MALDSLYPVVKPYILELGLVAIGSGISFMMATFNPQLTKGAKKLLPWVSTIDALATVLLPRLDESMSQDAVYYKDALRRSIYEIADGDIPSSADVQKLANRVLKQEPDSQLYHALTSMVQEKFDPEVFQAKRAAKASVQAFTAET